MGVPVERLNKIGEGSPHVVDWIERGDVDLVDQHAHRRRRAHRRLGDPPRRGHPRHAVPDDALGRDVGRARDLAGADDGEPEVLCLQELHGIGRAAGGREAGEPAGGAARSNAGPSGARVTRGTAGAEDESDAEAAAAGDGAGVA